MSVVSQPTVTVVIGCNAPPDRLEACLAALEPQRDGVEVFVREGLASPTSLRERFPWAHFDLAPGGLVPEHWRDGMDAATGDVVALTIAQMIPTPDWIATIRTLSQRFEAVGGAIEPGNGLGLADWGEYFCRYARDLPPFSARESLDLPGDNAAYARTRLESVRETYRDGFWEPEVHRRLAAEGVILWQDPTLVIAQGRSAGFAAFVEQRRHHGRAHGRQRGASWGRGRNVLAVLSSPMVPAVMTVRVARLVFAKRRCRRRLLMALPLVFVYNVVWALAEARGHMDELVG